MPAQNDVLDLKIDHCMLDNGKCVQISRRDDVGDIAMDKQISGLQTQNGGLRDSCIGATKPYYKGESLVLALSI